MNIQFTDNQAMLFLNKKVTVNERRAFDKNRVKSIQCSQMRGEYLVDFSRVSEKLFSFEKLLNHTLKIK